MFRPANTAVGFQAFPSATSFASKLQARHKHRTSTFQSNSRSQKSFALHLAYVGSESYHQMTPVDQKPGLLLSHQPLLFSDKRILYPQFLPSIYQEDFLLVLAALPRIAFRIRWSPWQGTFAFRVNYAWSKSQDLNSSISLAYAEGVCQILFNLRQKNRGLSDLNAPQVYFTGYLIYVTNLHSRAIMGW